MESKKNTPFKRRNNPNTSVQPSSVQPIVNSIQEQIVEEQPKVIQQPTMIQQQPVQPQIRKAVQQPIYYQPQNNVRDENREKYTATMDKELRIRVKIAAAKKGMQVSQYIEEAVLEKMGREGY